MMGHNGNESLQYRQIPSYHDITRVQFNIMFVAAGALKGLAGITRRTNEEVTTTITVMMVHDDTADTCANDASVLYKKYVKDVAY